MPNLRVAVLYVAPLPERLENTRASCSCSQDARPALQVLTEQALGIEDHEERDEPAN